MLNPIEAGLVIASFLLGSVPFGVLFTRGKGIDITKAGSGNIGATNVLRTVGKGAAAMTLLCDLLKGSLAVAIGLWIGVEGWPLGLIGLASVLGHDYSIFRGFKGGKGVATSLGVALVYTPVAGFIAVAVWLFTFAVARISSLGALVAFACYPCVVYFLGYPWEKAAISGIITVLLVYRHGSNISKLIKGTEGRVSAGERH